MEKTITDELRQRILPVLLFCQANKGDLSLYRNWQGQEDAEKKLFYAYYSGLFCRILCMLETAPVLRHVARDCSALLDKYNWHDIQDKDLELFKAAESCEVPDALKYIDGIDDIVWKDSSLNHDCDAFCWKKEHSWTFMDVRGSINVSPFQEE